MWQKFFFLLTLITIKRSKIKMFLQKKLWLIFWSDQVTPLSIFFAQSFTLTFWGLMAIRRRGQGFVNPICLMEVEPKSFEKKIWFSFFNWTSEVRKSEKRNRKIKRNRKKKKERRHNWTLTVLNSSVPNLGKF